MSFINYFCQRFFFKSGQSVWNSIFLTFSLGTGRTHTHTQTHTHTKKINLNRKWIECLKLPRRTMKWCLAWPGGNSSKQVCLIPMHASRHDSVTLAQPTQAHCGLSTPSTNCRLVYNTTTRIISWIWKKTFFSWGMSEQLLVRLTKLIEQH